MSIVITLLAFGLGVLHKSNREIGVRESLFLSAGYIQGDCSKEKIFNTKAGKA